MGSAAPAFRPGAVRIAAPLLGGGLVGIASAYVLAAATGTRLPVGELWTWVPAAVLAGVVVPVLSPQYRVELGADFLVLHGGRRRDIAWRDVIGLEVRKTVGVRTVVVHVSDGRRTPLRAPMSFPDRRFDDKTRLLVDWWTARRGGPDRV